MRGVVLFFAKKRETYSKVGLRAINIFVIKN